MSTGYNPQYKIIYCGLHSVEYVLWGTHYILWVIFSGPSILSCGLYTVGDMHNTSRGYILYSVDLSCGMYFIYCGKVTISCGGYPVGNILTYILWVYGVGIHIWCGYMVWMVCCG